jgi:tRNA(Ile)-lysidine synthase
MLERLIQNIESLHLFSPNETLLVGVSGGIDSIVLVDLLHCAGFDFAVAHCNFHLRGEQSDLDEIFVRGISEKYNKPFFCKSFDTQGYASECGISVEMAARDLRYEWFEEVRQSHSFDWILVAHHRDDQLETFFLNLARGTGISGLTGMKSTNGRVVRPLLFASRKEIQDYATDKSLIYREDETNSQTDFQRNKIRHLILPMMEELNPSFRVALSKTILHLRDASAIYQQAITAASEQVVRQKSSGDIDISIAKLKLMNPISTYLFEILKPMNFNGEVVDEIVQALDSQSGKQFFSVSHRAVLDREVILIQSRSEDKTNRYYIEESCSKTEFPIRLSLTSQIKPQNLQFDQSQGVAMIDKDKLQFPLILRKWQHGDFFQPLGMQGMKKLSDFFVDEKLSLPEKEETWLLTSGEDIVWIIGIRLDNRFKITPSTTNMLIIKLDQISCSQFF